MRFSGVILAIVYPVNPEPVSPVNLELTDRSVQSFSTKKTSGVRTSDWLNDFGAFVKKNVLIYYLSNGMKDFLYSSVSWPSISFSKGFYRILGQL